jgi:2-oxoglutarate ferredoxin oxidoreductase subunit beta
MVAVAKKLTRKDFQSDQEVRWCPGCGDYAILATVQRVMPQLGVKQEDVCFVSGIGCSSRFPYYMNTYGIHSIHGRAPAFATGVKLANPDLTVFIITGDGDALSIGGNHLIHVLRRNLDVTIILFNNQIYGLTKGQYSPTSEIGKKTKSTPMGSIDNPFKPLSLALGAEASFVARTVDVLPKHLEMVIKRAHAHKGTSFIEVYQNCNVFNDGAFFGFTDKSARADNQLLVEHGKPLIFGGDVKKGVRLQGLTPEFVEIGVDGVSEDDILVYDETNSAMAFMLSQFKHPTTPVPLGVFRAVERPSFDEMTHAQLDAAKEAKGEGDIMDLLHSGETWEV